MAPAPPSPPWSELRVLVTGGHGFLGRHLLAALRARGAAEILAPTSQELDLRDAAATAAFFAAARPDRLFHLAARVGGIGANRARPATFFHDNMAMGLSVLAAARAAGVGETVLVGTTCAYPRDAPVPLRETELWAGYPEPTNAPYGIAKRALLTLADAYRAEHGLRSITLLPANLYGPGDHYHPEDSHVVPALVERLCDARDRGLPSVTCWGDGSATRELLYVADCARALVLAAERYHDPLPLNLGSGVELSIRELAARIAAAAGFTGTIAWDPTRPAGQPRRCLDSSRARAALGDYATTSFADGLAATLRDHRERARARAAGRPAVA
ncbi:MAG TPA: GDP-L-fucose synthase [Kofleriaceae bacterium]|nr:GDP-L-fucose synthase [Kofleriaceae bacterium]